MFAYLIGESRLFQRIVTFLITALYKYSYLLTYFFILIIIKYIYIAQDREEATYLLTDEFLIDKCV